MEIKWNVKDPAIQSAKNSNIIIKNLDKSIDQKSLYSICKRFGEILSMKVKEVIIVVLQKSYNNKKGMF